MPGPLILMLLAVPSAVSAADGHRLHYDDAKQCHVAANVLALMGSVQPNYLPANTKYGREVADRFLPVIAYEGHKLGMSYDDMIDDLRTSYEGYSKRKLAELNAGTKSNQITRYNEILAEVRVCAEVPAIGLASE
ncbi:MAG: hypothetical protein Q8R44_02395 [Novosphingobium sp.]|nr:hypothetical protein [Novosphingobium sp.]